MDSKRQSRLQDLGITPWVSRSSAKPQPASKAAVTSAPSPAAAPMVLPVTVAGDERAATVAGMEWTALKAAVKACTACGLRSGCTQTVFGVGDERARWLFIGEAPGADEDKQGEPFVGRAGQLLNSMIAAVGLKREQVYIANILKCRPPGNRDPAPAEAELCRPFLERQIALIQPTLVVALGRIAAQNLLNTETPIGKLRGTVHRLGATPVVVTYHPAYLLRSPGEKRKAWADLQLAVRTFQGAGA